MPRTLPFLRAHASWLRGPEQWRQGLCLVRLGAGRGWESQNARAEEACPRFPADTQLLACLWAGV